MSHPPPFHSAGRLRRAEGHLTLTDLHGITVSYGTWNLPVHEPEKPADLIREKADI